MSGDYPANPTVALEPHAASNLARTVIPTPATDRPLGQVGKHLHDREDLGGCIGSGTAVGCDPKNIAGTDPAAVEFGSWLFLETNGSRLLDLL